MTTMETTSARVVKALIPIATRVAVALLRQSMASRSTQATVSVAPEPNPGTVLHEGVVWYNSGEAGVTYEDALLPYIAGADDVVIYDPYVGHRHQVRNLMELLNDLARARDCAPTTVELVTSATRGDDVEAQSRSLLELQDVVARDGIQLKLTFDDTHHDRWIEAGEWIVHLGKGLDFWAASPSRQGQLNLAERRQDLRKIGKTFCITYERKH